jgi:uncharacterized protein YbbC (DUF1343 family)
MTNFIPKNLLVVFLFSLLTTHHPLFSAQHVRVGAEVLLSTKFNLIEGKRLGVICNQTSIFPNRTHLVDTLIARGISVTALFSPEHGIRGTAAAGSKIGDQKDPKTGIPIYSLYGKVLKPTAEMMKDVDVLVFDLQDVGARFYTYSSTMYNCMETARDLGKKIIVLDRPNPINGIDIEGPVLDMELISFVGMFPIPIRHGLTLGELAKMIVGEGWLNYNSNVDLTVIPMEGWKRSMWFDETGLQWVPPSPNMKSLATATVYPGTCFFEATNITEGRGTEKPFEFIGAPYINDDTAAARLNRMKLPGVRFEPVTFTPTPDSVAAPKPKFKNTPCGGVYVHVTNRKTFKPVRAGLLILSVMKNLSSQKFQLSGGYLDHLIGDASIGERLQKGQLPLNILDSFRAGIGQYKQRRGKYLLYK